VAGEGVWGLGGGLGLWGFGGRQGVWERVSSGWWRGGEEGKGWGGVTEGRMKAGEAVEEGHGSRRRFRGLTRLRLGVICQGGKEISREVGLFDWGEMGAIGDGVVRLSQLALNQGAVLELVLLDL